MKLTIVLQNFDAPIAYPAAVTGRSGKVYGHATLDPARKAMCFRIPVEEWRKSAGKDIVGNMHRALSKWVPDIEIEHEPNDISDRERELMEALAGLQVQFDEYKRDHSVAAPAPETVSSEVTTTASPAVDQKAGRRSELKQKKFRELRLLAEQLKVENYDSYTDFDQLIEAILDTEQKPDGAN